MKTNRKAVIFILMALAASLASISAFAFIYGAISFSSTTYGREYPNYMSGNQWSNMMGNMGDMMGDNWAQQYSTPTPVPAASQISLFPIIGFITLVGAALTGTGSAFYYLTGRTKIILEPQNQVSTIVNSSQVNAETPIDTVSKTLTSDERKVVDVLTSHNGEYLQKYIRSETGLSRLKVHRIVIRLAERGIVTVEHTGNTNKVYLSSWLSKQPFTKINHQESTKHEMVMRV